MRTGRVWKRSPTLRGFQKDGSLRPLSILTGNGGLFLDFEMERGADGAMTGYAFPELLIDVVRLSKEGKRDAAHDLFDAHLPLIRYEQQPGAGLAVPQIRAAEARRHRLQRPAQAGRRPSPRPRRRKWIICCRASRASIARANSAAATPQEAVRRLSSMPLDRCSSGERESSRWLKLLPASGIDYPAAARRRRAQGNRGLHDGAPSRDRIQFGRAGVSRRQR